MLSITEMYGLIGLKARSPKSSWYRQGCAPSEGSREGSALASGGPGYLLPHDSTAPVLHGIVPASPPMIFPLCLSVLVSKCPSSY